jgi:hypothetical protein
VIRAVEVDYTQGYSGLEGRKGGIFISYRREDTAWPARCLYERLNGLNQVFMDVGSIRRGDDFPNEIRYNMSSCGVMLVLIGRNWLSAAGVTRTRRIDDPDDWVHVEIRTALQQNIWVVPVLIDGAKMPKTRDLPDTLQPITRVNAFTLSHEGFDREVKALTDYVDAVRKGHKILRGKWSLNLQDSEGADHEFRLSSDSQDYVITISLMNRGKSLIAVDGKAEATEKTSARIVGKEITLAALSRKIGAPATIKVVTLNSNSARSYLGKDKPLTSYRFELKVGDRFFEYESQEYVRSWDQRQSDQQVKQQIKQLNQQRREQNPENVSEALKYYAIGQSVSNSVDAALKNEVVKNALKNALKRAKR